MPLKNNPLLISLLTTAVLVAAVLLLGTQEWFKPHLSLALAACGAGFLSSVLIAPYYRSQSAAPRPATPSAGASQSKQYRARLNYLVRLAGGHAAAARLVADVTRRNPSASSWWCLEKAITDLERDRQ